MSVTSRNNTDNQHTHGQFLTPDKIVDFCLSKLDITTSIVIEPSAGNGAFLDRIRKKIGKKELLAYELDPELIDQYNDKEQIVQANFYELELPPKSIHFIGNPPYRSPAMSLSSHKEHIQRLRQKYNIEGMREEAALFIIQSVDYIHKTTKDGYISYILPKAIFQNNSKVFTKFRNFIQNYTQLLSVYDLDDKFNGVARDLVWVNFSISQTNPKKAPTNFILNDKSAKIQDFLYVDLGLIPFQKIFKKTYLGSVPCESIFLSCPDESKEKFMDRLVKLFSVEITKSNLVSFLSYNGKPHLRKLQNKNVQQTKQIETIIQYIKHTKELLKNNKLSTDIFEDGNHYKPIQHRHENRWYFRHDMLKKAEYVYQINPNPCHSFYFCGNPSNTSPDYYGYCDYDINRNSSPGACRTIPVDGIESNLTDEFKQYWDKNTNGLPYDRIFNYIEHVYQSAWWKETKKKCQRFYFGVPCEFQKDFLK